MSPVPTGVVRRNPLVAAVEARLSQLPITTPATTGYVSEPVDVPVLGPQGQVQRYWVLHPFAGAPSLEQDLADTAVDLEWTFQITAAAGYARDALAIATDIDALLYRHELTVPGHRCSPLRPPSGYDPGPVRPDRDISPHRFFLPLQYRTTITRFA